MKRRGRGNGKTAKEKRGSKEEEKEERKEEKLTKENWDNTKEK